MKIKFAHTSDSTILAKEGKPSAIGIFRRTSMVSVKRKRISILTAGIGLLLCAGFAYYQVTVPDIEARQKALYDGFDELQRLGAYVVGEDGKMLGKISKGLGSDSLGNEYGAGSEYKSDGLFNPYSKYGSPYSSTSAFNSYATNHPRFYVRKTELSIWLAHSLRIRLRGRRVSASTPFCCGHG